MTCPTCSARILAPLVEGGSYTIHGWDWSMLGSVDFMNELLAHTDRKELYCTGVVLAAENARK